MRAKIRCQFDDGGKALHELLGLPALLELDLDHVAIDRDNGAGAKRLVTHSITHGKDLGSTRGIGTALLDRSGCLLLTRTRGTAAKRSRLAARIGAHAAMALGSRHAKEAVIRPGRSA